jgi:hypothetical protein
MKKYLFLMAIVSLIACNKNDDNVKEDKYFDAENLYQLDLASIEDYWIDGVTIDTSFYMGANFEIHPGFIGGIRLFAGNGKAIWISVFETEEDAMNAMENRRNNVACIIQTGDSDAFEKPWWFAECMDYALFVNQYNTIVEIDFSSNAPVELIKQILQEVAEEIILRIDLLSN